MLSVCARVCVCAWVGVFVYNVQEFLQESYETDYEK